MAGRVRKTQKKRSVLEDGGALNAAFDQAVNTQHRQFSTSRNTEPAGMSDMSEGNMDKAEAEESVPGNMGRGRLNRAKRGGSQ